MKPDERKYTVVSYYGAKTTMLGKILPLFPPHRCYIEPFGGSAVVLLNKEPAPVEVYNDLSDDIVNFFRQLREHPDEIVRRLTLTPYARAEFDLSKNPPPDPESDLDRAIRFFIFANYRFNGEMGKKTVGWKRARTRNQALTFARKIPKLERAIDRLRAVQIEKRDFADVLTAFDGPDSFAYCDPPYIGFEKEYRDLFFADDHERLADCLRRFEGRAMVSYYDCPEARALYPGWHARVIEKYNHAGNGKQGSRRRIVKELLLMNYDPEQAKDRCSEKKVS